MTSGPYRVSSIHHFYEKLLLLQGDMYTDAGRQLAARRIAVMEEFLRTFYAEWDGRDAEALRAVEPPDSLNALLEGSIEVGDGVRRRSTSILQSNPIN